MDEQTRQSFFKEQYDFDDLKRIVWQLRAPDGCPWDREQTHESMHDCMIEEAYEVIEAVCNKDIANLREELGDVLLQVLLHCAISAEQQEFTFDEVVDELAKKLVRRHPHVFGEMETAKTAQEGLSRWEAIKLQEKMNQPNSTRGELSRVPHELPPQMRAKKIMKKAKKLNENTVGDEIVLQALEAYNNASKALTQVIEEYIKNNEPTT